MTEYIYDVNYDESNGTYSKKKRGKIVRCRDCKYYNNYQDLCERLKPGMVVMGDDFCSWGERIRK